MLYLIRSKVLIFSLITLIVLILPFSLSYGEENNNKEFYCIQISSSPSPKELIKKWKEVNRTLPKARVEYINGLYTLRVGFWEKFKEAQKFLNRAKEFNSSAFIRRCLYIPSRWIYPKVKKSKEIKEEKRVETGTIENLPDWDKEFEEVKKSIKPNIEVNSIKLQKETKEEKTESEKKKTENFLTENYLFLNNYWILGQKCQGCYLRETDFIPKLGMRFLWNIGEKLSLWGDVYGRLSYQKFSQTSRKRGHLGVRYLYLSTESLEDIKYKYPGFYLKIGRIPLIDSEAFWYYNFLDGVEGRYRSSILKGYLFLGKRLRDSRVNALEESTNLQNFKYLIARLDYQYRYNHHLGLFFIKENYPYSPNVNYKYSILRGLRRKTNLNWIALRLNGKHENELNYWLNLGFMWGRREVVNSRAIDCTADRVVESVEDKKRAGWGFDAGIKKRYEKSGLGVRVALGSGSSSGSRDFKLPKISSRMDRLFGPNRVRYYGELANPQLTNVGIFSFFGGYKLSEENWLEFNFINYSLLNKNGTSPLSRFFCNPSSRYLGWEFDLMLDGQIRRKEDKWRYLIIGSLFKRAGESAENRFSKALLIRVKRYW
ncbi:SPOR domain-containing protein [Thermovibrio sp.]